jgi:hypothetical protein
MSTGLHFQLLEAGLRPGFGCSTFDIGVSYAASRGNHHAESLIMIILKWLMAHVRMYVNVNCE